MKKKKLLAFTLVEILMTVAILGVIAAITIPPLVKNYQRAIYATALKKAYSLINQQLQKITADADCKKDLDCTGLFDATTTTQSFGDEFVKHFKAFNNCGINADRDCWAQDANDNFDGTSSTINHYDSNADYKFLTVDGMSIRLINYAESIGAPNCTTSYSTGELGYMTEVCGELWVDVNGLQKPNYRGRDIFAFWITNGKGALLYPQGGIDDSHVGWWNTGNHCSSAEKSGEFCTGKIMENGWIMDY